MKRLGKGQGLLDFAVGLKIHQQESQGLGIHHQDSLVREAAENFRYNTPDFLLHYR